MFTAMVFLFLNYLNTVLSTAASQLPSEYANIFKFSYEIIPAMTLGALIIEIILDLNAGKATKDKGYSRARGFFLCFFFGFIGYILVCALPDRKLRRELEENNRLLQAQIVALGERYYKAEKYDLAQYLFSRATDSSIAKQRLMEINERTNSATNKSASFDDLDDDIDDD